MSSILLWYVSTQKIKETRKEIYTVYSKGNFYRYFINPCQYENFIKYFIFEWKKVYWHTGNILDRNPSPLNLSKLDYLWGLRLRFCVLPRWLQTVRKIYNYVSFPPWPITLVEHSVSDPGCLSQILFLPIPDLGSRIQKQQLNMGLGSGIRKKPIPDPGFPIRVQGSKRHRISDPGSGSATMVEHVGYIQGGILR